jgi:hypothetical protein
MPKYGVGKRCSRAGDVLVGERAWDGVEWGDGEVGGWQGDKHVEERDGAAARGGKNKGGHAVCDGGVDVGAQLDEALEEGDVGGADGIVDGEGAVFEDGIVDAGGKVGETREVVVETREGRDDACEREVDGCRRGCHCRCCGGLKIAK